MDILANIAVETWKVLGEMSPYLLFGFAVAGVLSVVISASWVERHLGGRGFWPIFKASFFGVPLPLCSCAVIPVAASLRRHGSGKGATTAFLISTPQTGVDSILATFSLLGPVFAVFRPLAAFVSGIVGGSAVDMLSGKTEPGEQPVACHDECCSAQGKKRPALLRALRHGFVVLPRDIAKPLILGLIVAGIVSALVPDDFFAETLGTGFVAMIVMMALGVPIYVCATASIPVAAALMFKGVTPGAALVFLMTGPATNAATIATVARTLGNRNALIYLVSVAGTALVSGLLLDLFFEVTTFAPTMPGMAMLPQWVKSVSAAVVLLMVAVFLVPTSRHRHSRSDEGDHDGQE